MANNSKIQWADHTINFWTGCTKVSDGCKYCYMYRDQERYGKDPTELLRVQTNTINKVLKAAQPGDKIFTCSWSDFFIEEADKWRDWAWTIIKSRPDLNWQILTKRPERIQHCLPDDWMSGDYNVWLGVSVEKQEHLEFRLGKLMQVSAPVRFLSIEPILSEIDFNKVFHKETFKDYARFIDWVIVGGESGNDNGKYKYRESLLGWYVQIMKQCISNNVPLFVKQLGTHLAKTMDGISDRHGGIISEFPIDLQVRQFPTPKPHPPVIEHNILHMKDLKPIRNRYFIYSYNAVATQENSLKDVIVLGTNGVKTTNGKFVSFTGIKLEVMELFSVGMMVNISITMLQEINEHDYKNFTKTE